MPTTKSIMLDLEKKGSASRRAIYAKHGEPSDRMFGVSIADLKVIAKTIRGQQDLAMELYATGNLDAMYLAGIVANGSTMTRKQLEAWAVEAAEVPAIAQYIVPWVTVENPAARELALKWIKSKNEMIAGCGWSTYCGIVATTPDENLKIAEIEELLQAIVKGIHGAQNRVRLNMNKFVIAVGTYVKPLLKTAKAAAKTIGEVSVDMGETECQVPLATTYIAKVETAGRVGKKRKTMRC